MALTFSTSLSGLRANSDALGVTGNNIANSNTTAYKAAAINFADVYHDAVNARFNGAGQPVQIGSGVRSSGTTVNYDQGSLDDSSSSVNAGIQGNGYFVVASTSGLQSFTRAGDFSLDRNGFLVTPSGERVQGFQATAGGAVTSSIMTSLQVPTGQFAAPVETTEATLRMNLSTADATGTVFHAPVQVYDSKGNAHTLDLAFDKQAGGGYQVTATLDGVRVQLSTNGGPGADTASLTFDANGQLTTPATSLSVLPNNLVVTTPPSQSPLNGTQLAQVDINLYQTNPDGTQGESNITNFDAASAVTSITQDGFASGTLSGLSFSPDSSGTLLAIFNNGQTRAIGQLAIATFNAQEGLRRQGSNLLGETISSGPPSIGSGGTGGRGGVIGGVLEKSNVDIATEFTDLIIAQRGFQANSRVINTVNQTLQELLQII